MKSNYRSSTVLALVMVVCSALTVTASPLTTEFVYQGYFEVESSHGRHIGRQPSPADGNYDIQFALYDAEAGGTRVSGFVTNNAVNVADGFFSAALDFGPVFDGSARWLELSVRQSGSGAFARLEPRQALLATPYALYAARVDASGISGVLPGAVLGGTYTNAISFSNPGNTFIGNGAGLTGVNVSLSGLYPNAVTFSNPNSSFTGNGAGLTGVNAATLGGLSASSFWRLTGNANTTASNYLGTTDNQALELRVNGLRGLRIEPNMTSSPNLIGGSSNRVQKGIGVVIIGGEDNRVELSFPNQVVPATRYDTIVGGFGNRVSDSAWGTVVGGSGNSSSSPYGIVGGGRQNAVVNGSYFTILGGSGNWISSMFGKGSTMAGGEGNTMGGERNEWNTIVGGSTNSIGYSRHSTIGGGERNTINGSSTGATITGGVGNRADASYSTVGGGQGNTVDDSGDTQPGDLHSTYSTIGGGSGNYIGNRWVTIGGGSGNSTLAANSTIAGGVGNVINSTATGGSIPGGREAKASNFGQMAYASGRFFNTGDAQTSLMVCRQASANATEVELFLDGVSQRMSVSRNSTWCFDILVTGCASNGDSAAYQLRGAIKNRNGITSIVGVADKTTLAEDNATWDVNVVADDTNDALSVRVTGAEGASIRWVANVRTAEVTH